MRKLAVTLILAAVAPALHAQDAGNEFFEKKIRPVLVEHCYECHAANAKKVRGGLLLDSRDGVRKGGESGPAIVPGDPDKSPLITAVRYAGETKMPKNGKLPEAIIADLEAWVKMGAPDPREKAPTLKIAKTWDEIVRERRTWWSLQPVKKLEPPTPKHADWSSDPIDRFLLAAIEAKGLTPAPVADPRTLIRRLNLVLTGLPPSAEEAAEFAKAWDAPGAKRQAVLEQLVDRLLASPHFGERWARHWMDVVRFTETHGNEWNYDVHHAWRYRDYLIRAVNDDVPYDQLVREHIAGDLLPKPRFSLPSPLRGRGAGAEGAARFNESVIGTAFYRFGEVNHDDCIDLRSIGYDLADNQIDTLSKAFQAMTLACARCHDHKLDAISQRDYHGLLGILRSSRNVAHTIDAPEVNAEIIAKMRELKKAIRNEMGDAWLEQIHGLEKLKEVKLPGEHPLTLLQKINAMKPAEGQKFAEAWKKIAAEHAKDQSERTKFNAQFTTLADFRKGTWQGWQVDGQGLRGSPSASSDFAIATDKRPIASLLPGGAFTHALSEKLNGTLRSPVFTIREGTAPAEPRSLQKLGSAGDLPSRKIVGDQKFISFQVLGDHASAVRLVSNNCQLNYRNFRYLKKNELHWITFPIPPDAEGLRVYAELMTKFDNPKFPDQLGSLGGGKDFRVTWEQAALDPRSYFGVTQVVLHDQPAPPKATLSPMRGIIDGPAPKSNAELTVQYIKRIGDAIRAWQKDQGDADDVVWLNAFLEAGILGNRADLTPKLAGLIAEYRKLDVQLALPRIAPGLADFGAGIDQPIFARGDCMKPGAKTPRGYIDILTPKAQGRQSLGSSTEGSGRLRLAHLIAAPENPLTARVMVNRVWHHLFGAGLVRTVDDFGHVGELPSHPDLLDYLADRFMRSSPSGRGDGGEGGWSMKKLIRSIVLSRAFRLAHTPTPAMLEADPENRLLARYPSRRLEAEAIRDALLATSGRLDRTLFGLSIPAHREKEYADRRLFKGPLDGDGRRSIYIKMTLMEPPKFLEVFNFPGGKVCQGRRDLTNTPAQALALLNDPFVAQQADFWAKRVNARKDDTVAIRIGAMLQTALGREPRPAERGRFERFVSQAVVLHQVPDDHVLGSVAVWRDVAHVIFNLQEFITIP